jgi:hypothetical protein
MIESANIVRYIETTYGEDGPEPEPKPMNAPVGGDAE